VLDDDEVKLNDTSAMEMNQMNEKKSPNRRTNEESASGIARHCFVINLGAF
jgi:hypothetical protein